MNNTKILDETREKYKSYSKIKLFFILIVLTFGYLNLIYPLSNYPYILLMFLVIYAAVSIKLTLIYAFLIFVLAMCIQIGEKHGIVYSNNLSRVIISALIIIIAYLFDNISKIPKHDINTNREINKVLLKPIFILDSIFYKKTMFSCGEIIIDRRVKSYLTKYINTQNTHQKRDIINVFLKNSDLDISILEQINVDKIIYDFFRENNINLDDYSYDFIEEIDELYSTNKTNKSKVTSKAIENYHIDGHVPNIFKGFKTFRILILVDKDTNDNSYTDFFDQNLCKGNYWVFDYNRQVHRGVLDTNSEIIDNRILIKKHFILFPKRNSNRLIRKYKNMIINNNKRRRKEQNKERPFLSNIFVSLSHIKNKMMEPLSINEY